VPDLLPYPPAKRVLDRGGGILLALLATPLFGLALGAGALDRALHPAARGRWLIRDRRISAGREFDLLKFRVLREDVMTEVEATDGNARLREAERESLTASGALIKRWYLDELPQLVNVIRGELSLVGPRPWPAVMVESQVAKGLDYRLRIRAGWTGPAQASKGEPDASFERSDLAYVEATRTLSGRELVALDLRTLGKTLRTMLRGEGLQF
jgi:lipopolysaccharide/colanic/teichoic acid biosynthesis glycosyltransferase